MFKIKLDWSKASTKIVLLVFVSLLFLSGYYTASSYNDYLKNSEEQTLQKLQSISNTLALLLDGEDHQYLLNKYPNEEKTEVLQQDSVYNKVKAILIKARDVNELQDEEINTLFLDPKDDQLYFLVSTGDTGHFREKYEGAKDHPQFFTHYKTGSTIGQYSDEYGTWLTAFSPLLTKSGEVTGIVEVDETFEDFLERARLKLYKNLLISLIIFVLTAILLLRYVRIVLVKEEETQAELKSSYDVIHEKNQDILNSINYAKKIQRAILPPIDLIKKNLPNSFVLYEPKDIISGDFYFFYEIETHKRFIIAAADCTGHGVPGALMSMIGNDLLMHIIRENPNANPGEILTHLNRGVVGVLKQDGKYGETKDGMDIGLCLIDKEKKTIDFAAANRPLLMTKNGEIEEVKADKKPIGGYSDTLSSTYTNHTIPYSEDINYYFFSDGYADQFGGPNGKKFMLKNLKASIIAAHKLPFEEQHKNLLTTHNNWKGLNEQTDDVLVVGFSVKE